MEPRPVYDKKSFVGKNRKIPITEWLEGNDSQGLAIVGTAGIGKSWLLNYICEWLKEQNRMVFWLNLSRVSYPDHANKGLKDRQSHQELLERWVQQAGLTGLVPLDDFSVTFENLLHKIIEHICQYRADLPPVFIVDGIDEIDPDEVSFVEDRILSKVLSFSCSRVLLAYREDSNYKLRNHFVRSKTSEKKLTVFELEERDEYLQLWQETFTSQYNRDIRTIHLEHYQWNHPYLSLLLWKSAARNAEQGLSSQDIFETIHQLISPQTLHTSLFVLLSGLAEKESWRSGEMQKQFGVSPDDIVLIPLFQGGILRNLPGTQRYGIVEEVRQLILDYKTL